MAQEKEEGGSKGGKEGGLFVTGPKKGPWKLPSLPELADEFMLANLRPVVEVVLYHVLEGKHLPSAMLLARLAALVQSNRELSVEVYESFAVELIGELMELESQDGVD